MKTFSTAYELAIYIKSLNVTPLEEEQLMFKGITNKRLNGVYSI